MNKTIYCLLLNRNLTTGNSFIRNKNFPTCINCLYFIEDKTNYPYDSIPNDEKYGRCKKFGEVNLITGIIDYDLASNCRLNDNKCGIIGLEYISKNKS
jgi:hypothetical protein